MQIRSSARVVETRWRAASIWIVRIVVGRSGGGLRRAKAVRKDIVGALQESSIFSYVYSVLCSEINKK